jgi:hypothetical protein
MKRLLLSVACGIGITFIYAFTVGPLSLYIKSDRINHLLWLPVGWPYSIYSSVFPPLPNGEPYHDKNIIAVAVLACDILLYGSLTYFYLFTRSLRKPKAYDKPPLPNL